MEEKRKPTSLELGQTILSKMAGRKVTHLKLQKLCCLADGWWLAYNDATLVSDRQSLAKNGPVFKELYQFLSGHGHEPLPGRISGPMGEPDSIPADEAKVHRFVDWIVGRYGALGEYELCSILHAEDSPWKTYAKAHGFQVREWEAIPVTTLREHYLRQRAHERI